MGHSEIIRGFSLRNGRPSDSEAIKFYAGKYNLDTENLLPEHFYIVEKNGMIAGFGRHKHYEFICEISTLGVIEHYRNMGAGEILINKLVSTAPTLDIWLVTIIPDYFERFGFKIMDNPPAELAVKAENTCKKLCAPDSAIAFMKYFSL